MGAQKRARSSFPAGLSVWCARAPGTDCRRGAVKMRSQVSPRANKEVMSARHRQIFLSAPRQRYEMPRGRGARTGISEEFQIDDVVVPDDSQPLDAILKDDCEFHFWPQTPLRGQGIEIIF